MPNAYKNIVADITGTAADSVYVVPASTTALLQSLYICNDGGDSVNVTVQIKDTSAGTTVELLENADVAIRSNISVVDRAIVLETTDVIIITASDANRINVVGSVLEIT